MAKSSGNNILPGEILSGESPLLSKAYSASVIRFLIMQAHYRSILDFSDQAILAAERGHNRLIKSVDSLSKIEAGNSSTLDIVAWKDRCYDAMNDDFNTPILISHLFEGVNFINVLNDKSACLTAADLGLFIKVMSSFIFDVLGLGGQSTAGAHDDKLDGTIRLLIEMRNAARANKNYLMSDRIREGLANLNIQVEDAKDGTRFKY